jgi:hypothetical protein
MASLINSGKIDATYPIAGQDNDTQGFRTNYQNIKNNFTVAASEITALQGNVATLQGQIYSNVNVAGYISAGNLTVTSISYVNQEIINTTDVITGNATISGNIIATSIVSPAGTGGNITINPDGPGDVVFPVTTELYIQSGAISANVYSGALVVTGGIGMVGDLNIGGNLLSTGSRIDASFQYNAPTTNFYYTISGNIYRFVLDPTGAITNGTVVLPATTVNGTVIRVSSTQTVTNFQTLPGAGTTLVPSANITLTGGTSVEYLYHATESKWYKVS